ncbi:MAG TPA: ABC transporter substrate-binding protein [Chloroflexota bacterium]|nr:ABC transporter substrate-binding protein [Chloroflexota bacterium]
MHLPSVSRAAVCLVVALLLAGCSPPSPDAGPSRVDPRDAPAGEGQPGGTMTVATTGDAVSFHPYKVTDTASRGYQGLVYAGGLVAHDPHNPEQFIPWLAESWSVSDDRLTYTFHLRPDLRWSDGVPITSADFKWTFEQALKPENQYPYASNFAPIAAYEAPDPGTVVVTLKEPLAVGLDNADVIGPLPKHVWENLDWNDAAKNPEIMAPTVVSGPFKLKEWQRDSHATFVANDLYFKGRPKLDSYVVQIVGTQSIAFQKLRTGEVDRADFDPADYEQATRLDNATVYEWWPAAATWNYLGFNLRKPVLQDVRVRRALAYGIDRQLIIDKIQYGLARPIYSAYPSSCWCYNPDVPHYDYDPERGRQLLAEAGWAPGPDGILVKDGERLRLRMIYGPNTSKVRERIATVAQEEFRQLGVEVDIQGLEWAAFLQAVHMPPFDWDMTVLGWTSTLDPHWMYQVWSEENIPKLNAGAYVNKRVEQLFDQGVHAFTPEERKPAYQEIQKILADDLPYIFLTMSKSYTGISNRIGGIEVTPLGIGHNIEQWYVK